MRKAQTTRKRAGPKTGALTKDGPAARKRAYQRAATTETKANQCKAIKHPPKGAWHVFWWPEPQTCRTRAQGHMCRMESCLCTFGDNEGVSHLSARHRCRAGRWQGWAALSVLSGASPLREPLCRAGDPQGLRPHQLWDAPTLQLHAPQRLHFPGLPLLSEQLALPNSNLCLQRDEHVCPDQARWERRQSGESEMPSEQGSPAPRCPHPHHAHHTPPPAAPPKASPSPGASCLAPSAGS